MRASGLVLALLLFSPWRLVIGETSPVITYGNPTEDVEVIAVPVGG